MRRARYLAPGWVDGQRSGTYHCVSRVVDKRFVLEEAEREHFVWLMRLYEEFCGVQVLDYCVMSNHFHILLEVPVRPEEGISEREFYRRLGLLYSEAEVEEIRGLIRQRKRAEDEAGVAEIKERYLCRMWDLSQFMKTLKQRFTQWFNARHDREGTLWEGRFKSVIVEDGYAARVMAAYIDLNPVRAGIVERPEEYRWCGVGEAVAGKRKAREGIERVMGEFEEWVGSRREKKSWREVIASYRVILYTDGEERFSEDESTGRAAVARRGVTREEAERIRAAGGKLSTAQMLRFRVRHFVDGMVIGSESFVDGVFEARPEWFGPRRRDGARKIRGCETPLRAMRDLGEGVT